ncbi:alpha/beta hydrolase [Mesorhizobium sp. Z1-4]|uniref:alpha/beta fold hydrolase n=1 Tax=Mesorhizobium sp. Z1-4 TaxID=2448478 RepID=UPI000FDC7B83|nr:alpha/beta hydrolase [Mesorhizobium sp. Z1-4]
MKSTLIALAATAMAILAPSSSIAGEIAPSGYVEANGVSYYYEIEGEGEPLLLLHGGLGSHDMFAPTMPQYTANRQVIAVDLHGHGRTQLGDRDVSPPDIGRDLGLVLAGLGYDQVDVMGYSFGGYAALHLAASHPDRVRRVAIVSSNFARDGFYAEMLPQQAGVSAAMADMMKGTPMYEAYAAVAPDVSEFPRLLDNMGAFMRSPYDWREQVKSLEMPVMLVFADSDMVRPEHIVEYYQLLGGGLRDAGWQRENMAQNRLAILPGLTHYDLFLSPRLAETVLPFLDGKIEVPVWTGEEGR